MTTAYCNGKREEYSEIFKRIDFDDLSDNDVEYIEDNYCMGYQDKYMIDTIEDAVINHGSSFVDAVEKFMGGNYVWMFESDINDDDLFYFKSGSGEVVFTIDDECIGGYRASNSMGYGDWVCKTVEECMVAISEAYGDIIIDMRGK